MALTHEELRSKVNRMVKKIGEQAEEIRILRGVVDTQEKVCGKLASSSRNLEYANEKLVRINRELRNESLNVQIGDSK